MIGPEPLQYGQYYHIYNRGNNGETLFRERRNYVYFLNLYDKYIEPIAETYAYCLMGNHFHFLVRIKDWQSSSSRTSRSFATLFSTYAKAFNKAYRRTGSLFEKPFRRKRVDKDRYFTYLIVYIHRNPQRHGLVDDFHDWPHSSYRAMLSDKVSHIRRLDVLRWFDGRASFEAAHVALVDEGVIEPLITDDRV